jgi:hypothetical protein
MLSRLPGHVKSIFRSQAGTLVPFPLGLQVRLVRVVRDVVRLYRASVVGNPGELVIDGVGPTQTQQEFRAPGVGQAATDTSAG